MLKGVTEAANRKLVKRKMKLEKLSYLIFSPALFNPSITSSTL